VPSLGGGEEKGLLTKRLGVEQQAVHIKYDSGWRARELHDDPV
jgi:hypothetical protein